MPAADPTAVLGRRFLALLIDLVIVTIIAAAVLIPAWNSRHESLPANEFQCAGSLSTSDFKTDVTADLCIEVGDEVLFVSDDDAASMNLMAYGVFFGWYIANSILLQAALGGTVGKLLTGLRVIRQDTGAVAGIGWLALRALVGLIDVGCCILIGGIMALSTKGHRRLADMAAGTLVVSRGSVGQPPSVPGLTSGYGTAGYGTQGWGAPPPQGTWAPPSQETWAPPATGPGAPTAPDDQTAPGYDPATGYGPAAGQSPTTGYGPAVGGQAGGDAEGPRWDEARNTYIQYDRNVEAWLQWDDVAGRWKPIDQ